jgi:hypothetical protein
MKTMLAMMIFVTTAVAAEERALFDSRGQRVGTITPLYGWEKKAKRQEAVPLPRPRPGPEKKRAGGES